MSGAVQRSMFFLGLPDLNSLVCITVTLQEDDDLRSQQMKTCRELVLLYSDVLASPSLDSFTQITVVMAKSFFQKGVLQLFGQRRSLQLGPAQCVFPGVLQCCLSYSLICRLSPSWNKAGLYLIAGKDFLTERGRLRAVSTELNTCEGQLCISIEANTVRLQPTTLEDFDLSPLVLRRFCGDPEAILDPSSTGGAIWCHILPSMKKGQIITISHQLPRDGPFRTYRDLQNHWNCLYGYTLPDLAEEEVVYCSVYFRLVGERLFTYPLSCIRLQPVQRCPPVDLQGALGSFLSDIRGRLQSVCGFPARLTSKPCYHTGQVLGGEQVNLTSSFSIRQVLTPPPPPPPASPPPPRPVKPWFPLSQQDRPQRLDGCGFRSSLMQSQVCTRDGDWPSSSSSSSSSSFLPLFQPASSLTSSSSSVLAPLPSPSQTPVISAPRLVPIFKNKCPSRHVNVALLKVQKMKEQLSGGGGGGEERERVTLPVFRKTPTTAPVSSLSALTLPPPPIIPRFSHHSAAPQPAGHPQVKHLSSLSPAAKSRLRLNPAPQIQIKFKSRPSSKNKVTFSMDCKPAAESSCDQQDQAARPPPAAPPEPPRPHTSSDVSSKDTSSSSRKGVVSESKPKKSRSAVRDVDVEQMARSNQLSKLNSATLLAWLRGRGALVSSKHRKEELMLKVMSCLAEA